MAALAGLNMKPRVILISVCILLSITTLSTTTILAQSDSGSAGIEGTVRDQNGAVVQGATVIIKNKDTNLERTVTTNSNGQFATSVLPVGAYVLTVKAAGFADTPTTVSLTVGEKTPVDIVLGVQGTSVSVDVTGDTDLIDSAAESAGTTISPRLVSDLPVRGRNFTEFAQLTPAIVQEQDRNGLVIAGQRSINSNIAVDGADFNDALQGNQRGGNEQVFSFPQTAIREFQVVRSGASAEIGRTGAGFVNVVTKSGTNEFHGEFFYFNRNKTLTSPDAFGQKLDNAQNQFGGSVGGPLQRDKAFFFLGLEQNFLRVPFAVKFDTIPGQVVPASITALEGEQRGTNNPTAFFGRIDIQLNANHTLNIQTTATRFRGENFLFENPRQNLSVEGNYSRENESYGVKTSVVSVLGPRVVNEFRAQIGSDERLEEPNVSTGQAVVANFGTFGGDRARPRRFESTRYQATNNITFDTGRHNLRFGFDINANDVLQQRESNTTPRFDFESRVVSGVQIASSLDNYLAGRPRRFRQSFGAASPEVLIYTGVVQEYAFFVQDKIKVTKDLKFNLGLRYEAQINPQPRNPNPAFPQTALIPNDKNQWQPRTGLAWDVRGNGDTVLRLSAGLFAARTPANLFQRVTTNNGLNAFEIEIAETGACRNSIVVNLAGCRLRGPNAIVTFPNALGGVPTGFTVLPRVFGFDPDFRNPRSFQASATLEHRLSQNLVFTAGYIRNSTWNLQRRIDKNLGQPTIQASGFPIFPATRPNTTIAQLEINQSTAHSTYDALTLSLRRRFTNRFQFEANYTLADNRDDDSNERNFSRQPTLNPFNLKAEAGPSKQDVRHSMNLGGVFDLGRGFSLSGIIVTRSGFPYTALIEDGSDTNNDLNDGNERAVVNGVVSGRHAFRQPYFFNLDIRVLKAFRVGEGKKIDLSAEVYNVTRNSNRGFGVDGTSNFCTSSASLASTTNPLAITCPTGFFPSRLAGEPTSAPSTARFGGPRQLQLGARFSF